MIFLTMGTQEPFDRLVRAMDDWYSRTERTHVLFGQIADQRDGGYVPRNFEWVSRLSPVDYAARFAQADLIVSHAGMGSILTALHHSKPIVVMPRRAELREHRNDHQLATVKRLGVRPGIYVAEDEMCLPDALERVLSDLSVLGKGRLTEFADPRFTDALRAFLLGQPSS
jgi:UDP-N-acetylglucosamine transferase subunit ALG13